MADKRIKDLTGATPTGAEYLPFDSSGGGTKNNTVTTVVDVGNQTIVNPIIGVENPASRTLLRTPTTISGALDMLGNIRMVNLDNGSGIPNAYITMPDRPDGSTLIDEEHSLVLSGTHTIVSGWGGPIQIIGGMGGSSGGAVGYGGRVLIEGGQAGSYFFDGSGSPGSDGGGITLFAGGAADVNVTNVDGGAGGSISIQGRTGGQSTAPTGNGNGGSGGGITTTAGNGASSAASGSGGNGGAIAFLGGTSGGSYAGYSGDGGGIQFTGGDAGQGDSHVPQASKQISHMGVGGYVIIQAGSPTNAYNYVSGAAGPMYIQGGNSDKGVRHLSGSTLQIGGQDLDGTSYSRNFSRIFLNATPDRTDVLFKGQDIFLFVSGARFGKRTVSSSIAAFGGDLLVSGTLYAVTSAWFGTVPTTAIPQDTNFFVSGTQNLAPFGPSQKNIVLSGDTILSGTLIFRSSSTNPVNFVFNGDTTGGLAFSGSMFTIANPGGQQVGGVSNVGVVSPIVQRDAYFFVSGVIGGKDASTRGIMVIGGDLHISGNLTTDGSNNPLCKVVSASTYQVLTTDFGNAVAMTMSGSITASFTSNLTASFPSGRFAVVVIQVEATGALGLISMSGGATMNGVSTPVTLPTGSGVYSFTSRNGLNWYR